jgi:hypothetical protein
MRGPETITSVTITIETRAAEFSHVTNDQRNGTYDEGTVTAGIVEVLDTLVTRIHERGIESFDSRPIISPGGVNVGRVIIEREEEGS